MALWLFLFSCVHPLAHASVVDLDLSPYHTSSELLQRFHDLSVSCPFISISDERGLDGRDTGMPMTAVWVSSSSPRPSLSSPPTSKLRGLLFFGEHARELISPETALGFAQLVCADYVKPDAGPPKPGFADKISALLGAMDLVLFPNINWAGRQQVEAGRYCVRANPGGVDLNRNWGDHWQSSLATNNQNPGSRPFSEAETRMLRSFATSWKPTFFVTVHSGVRGMYTPLAWSGKQPARARTLNAMLERLNPLYCNCAVGAAGTQVGYLCPGTCLDYVFDSLGTPYAFALEIYAQPDVDLPSCFLQLDKHGKRMPRRPTNARRSHGLPPLQPISLIEEEDRVWTQLGQNSHFPIAGVDQTELQCLQAFNPMGVEYESVVHTWAHALVHLAHETVLQHAQKTL